MGRTSSSLKRKHSKKKGYRKKKSRRSKSKKLRHRDDSSSSCSDDESTSSSLNSYSSSEGERKRKRARSRSRSEVKVGRKRSRRRYSSEDSSDDDSIRVKKRKKSRKSKKVKKKKKRSKRDVYLSSASSDSESCSTCKEDDISSDERGSRERSRGRSREMKKDHRNRKTTSETRRSISPSSSYNDGERIENMTMESNQMRLKSVITIANIEKEEEDDTMKNDELKEEIVYDDDDDYPSSKSNDSVDLGDRSNSSPDKRSVVKEVDSGSNHGDAKEKEGHVSGNVGSEADDLESILRQKALENLSRFRGGVKKKPVVTIDDKPKSDQSDVKQLTGETLSTTPVSQPFTHRSRFTWRRDPSAATAKDEKAATYSEAHYSGSQPAEPKLQTSRVEKSVVDPSNAGQKSTAVVETPSSVSKEEGSSKEPQNESNDNSQFEKKTMSVMRGGEMVEVSYKVYIPKRTPALARRQLKR